MFSVIFEVFPKKARFDEYLAIARHLKPSLETIDGFVDNERFESKTRPGWLLSHSTWRDEKSVIRWRTMGEHHAMQAKGRGEILRDYHLRVGDVTADTNAPGEAPVREQRFDETEIGAAKFATLTEMMPKEKEFNGDPLSALGFDPTRNGMIDHDVFASIYNLGKIALLISWKDAAAAKSWTPDAPEQARSLRHRTVRVVRDYGMFDRREAPQYYPDVPGHETKHAA
ncbi:MAG TPA: antibiotic biosynthesis monooxygenase [Rhizomicrobium sp.]|jgi:heme-degrading monooxygenase HmoA